MTRRIIHYCLAAVACLALQARGEVKYEESIVDDDNFTVIRLTVTPAAEPMPAFRYRLLARDIDLKPGNAAPYYYRAFAELQPTMKRVREQFDEDTQLQLWYDTGAEATPIADLPLEKVRQASRMTDSIYRECLLPAFARSACNWDLNVEELRGVDVVSFRLEEFQYAREVARMLALRTRLAIAEHHYDDAITLMRQQYRLGHDVAQVPFLVSGLIGMAIDGISNGTLLDLIANPESPNMYWALTQLPQPPINLQPAARFELEFGTRMFPFIDHAETARYAPEEWNRLFTRTVQDFSKVAGGLVSGDPSQYPEGLSAIQPVEDAKAGIAATGVALMGYSHAKERLIAQGMDRDHVEKMAVGQVLAIYTERVYRRFADEYEKLWYMPYADMRAASDKLEKNLRAASWLGSGEDRELLPIVSVLMPAIQNVRSAQVRLERQIAALRVIEALRMFAAVHNGALPKSLTEITAVPIPNNPATGQPFDYKLDGKTAIISLPVSEGLRGANGRYEIQIANAKK